MGFHHDPSDMIADAARAWIVRLTSGEMSGEELRAFKAWTAKTAHAEVFQQELDNWHRIGALRGLFSRDGVFLGTETS